MEPSGGAALSPSARRRGLTVKERLSHITQRARAHPGEVFANLAHHLDEAMFTECFRELKSGKATGVDGVTKEAYGERLDENIAHLVGRLKRETYHPQPSRRTEIPKGNGKTRALGIPSFEDKLVQRGVAKVLERVYEEKFCDFSFGFRPGRGCHDALKELSRVIGTKKVNYVVEADIRGFFDHVQFDWLLKMLSHRVADRRIHLLVKRFLGAGVMRDGRRVETTVGTPQGGVVSPLLANVYLHYVLDVWFQRLVAPQSRGEAYLVRYADDFVACFEHREDAQRFYGALPNRLARFGLAVAPEKTRVIEFGRFARRDAACRGDRTAVFDFLGFTHYSGRSRKGRFKLKWRTSKVRFRKSLRSFKEWLRAHRTQPLAEIWAAVRSKLRGHCAYFGVSDNSGWLDRYRDALVRLMFRWLNRRSQRSSFTVARFRAYLNLFPIRVRARLVNLNSWRVHQMVGSRMR